MMRLSIRHALVATMWLGVLACPSGGDETAILIEVMPGTVDPSTLDEVLFRVMGPGIEAGERVARAPLQGSDARAFPLSLTIRGTAQGAGPFTIDIEARAGGALRAVATGGSPVAFENGKVVREHLVLHAVDEVGSAPDAGGAPLTTASDAAAPALAPPARDSAAVAVDARVAVAADAAIDQTPAGTGGSSGGGTGGRTGTDGAPGNGDPPGSGGMTGGGGSPEPGGTGGMSGTGGARGNGGAGGTGGTPGTGGANGGGCDVCDNMCTIMAGQICIPAPDGTPCRGNSGMICRRCQCGN